MISMSERPTISVRKLADRLGVSVATVSRALNNHPEVSSRTRARVLAMADETGYMPRIGQRMADVIGLVYPSEPVRSSLGSFEAAILDGILGGVNEHQFDVMIINLQRDMSPDESYTQFFRRKGVRGVIIRSVDPTLSFYREIARERFPSVLVADRSDDQNVNYIYSDSRQPSITAVEHLIRLGHRRIGLGLHLLLDSDHRDRRDGYLEALDRHGIEPEPGLIKQVQASVEGGARIVDEFMAMEEPPTALFITDPLTSVGALHECLERGIRVPGDLSLVGFDDSDVRMMTHPRCTVVYQDAVRLGQEAARWLTESLKGHRKGQIREALPGGFANNRTTGVCPTVGSNGVRPNGNVNGTSGA